MKHHSGICLELPNHGLGSVLQELPSGNRLICTSLQEINEVHSLKMGGGEVIEALWHSDNL